MRRRRGHGAVRCRGQAQVMATRPAPPHAGAAWIVILAGVSAALHVAVRELGHPAGDEVDHVLGVIWVIRMVAQCKGYEGLLHVYGNDKVMKVIKTIIDMILAKKQLAKVAERVVFHQLEDGDCFEVGDMKLECFC